MAGSFRQVAQFLKLQPQTSLRNQLRLLTRTSCAMTDKAGSQPGSQSGLTDFHHPSDFEKKVLVWTKMYPSVEAIPKTVTYSTIRKSRDMLRIRVNIGMVLATAFGCCIMVYTGRKARSEGDSLQKRGLAWQQKMREEGQRERDTKTSEEKDL